MEGLKKAGGPRKARFQRPVRGVSLFRQPLDDQLEGPCDRSPAATANSVVPTMSLRDGLCPRWIFESVPQKVLCMEAGLVL